jgi:hypothetical protein
MATSKIFLLSLGLVAAAVVAWTTVSPTPLMADEKPFKPIMEAELPVGFPEYTPVGEVRLKQYPAYRKAEADSASGRAFWTLFTHIKKNDIAMTAPVEMTYKEAERPTESKMSFLYGRPDMGNPGEHGGVQVVDVPGMTVVSTGVRGPRSAKTVAEARQRISRWLEENKDRYIVDGQLRVMAYNSPFVPRDRNYFEVEIPVRRVENSAAEGSE